MEITAISDLHGYYPELEGGDLLIIAGDITARDKIPEWNEFFNWLDQQNYERKIMIAGNHDNFCKSWCTSDDSIYDSLLGRPSLTYLCDSGTEFEGLKIWGSPWSLKFEGINPHCMAFTGTEEELAEKFALIPDDIDILITHSPPYGILDKIKPRIRPRFEYMCHVGSKSLGLEIGLRKKPPKLWVWGHIHEAYGEDLVVREKPCKMINASIVDEDYEHVNKPIRIEL